MAEKKRMSKAMASSKEGLGISGFVLGILSLVLAGSFFISAPLAITGFIFCMIQQKKNPMKLAKAGIIINVIAFILSVLIFITLVVIQKNTALA